MAAPSEFSVARLQQTLKKSGNPWEAGVTPFSETAAQQKRFLLGYRPGPGEESLEARERTALANLQKAQAAAAVGAPASFDLRNVGGKNYITSIRNQNPCGSCVAFGTVATVEGTLRWLRNDPNLDVDY